MRDRGVQGKKAKVYMFVMNNCKNDSRVLKEARTLAQAGYEVKIIAVLDSSTEPYEFRDGFEIVRVVKDPLHYRILRLIRKFERLPNRLGRKIRRRILCLKRRFAVLVHRLAKAIVYVCQVKLNKPEPRTAHIGRPSRKVRILAIIKEISLFPFALVGKAFVYTYQGMQKAFKTLWKILYKSLVRFLMLFHKPLSFMDYYVRAYNIVQNSPADIYHAHDLNTLLVAWWAKRKLGGELVYDSHELYTETSTLGKFERRLLSLVEKVLIKKCDAIITVNESIASELVKRYRSKKPVIIKNCPDMEPVITRTERLRQKLGIDDKTSIVLYQGGLSPNRGLENLLFSFRYIPGACLVFMGWGRLEDHLKDLAKKEDWLGKRVFFIPPVPQSELLSWTASADVGVIPYRAVGLNNYYTLPNKLFEYIAAGIPVAASNFPELRKIVLGHKLGEVFNPEDPKDIARAINFILSDPERYQQMKENAKKAAQIYNWENEKKKLLELYHQLTKERERWLSYGQ